MNISIIRQACCYQDDQIGPLHIVIELTDASTIKELATIIVESKFLQFSSTNSLLEAHSGEIMLLTISSTNKVNYLVNESDIALLHIKKNEVKFVWPK